ncbi:MAG: hypothetical protein R3E32_20450 [Chitinophagales bacterium]
MENPKIEDGRIARVSDIPEQIEELNKMIALHKGKLGSSSMLSQYEYMKSEFTQELHIILQSFQITLQAA